MLTEAELSDFRKDFNSNKQNIALSNAINNSNILNACTSIENFSKIDSTFSHEITPESYITDQYQSGTCWIHGGLNMLRSEIRNKYKIVDFEFSQSYLAFYDKLEKCNYFLSKVIETSNLDPCDRYVEYLFKNPIQDGGHYFMFVNLVQKYGLVPKDLFPETINSMSTNNVNLLLSEMLRTHGAKLRTMSKKDALAEKNKMMKDYYDVLCISYGRPPLPSDSFSWTIVKNVDGKIKYEIDYSKLNSEKSADVPKMLQKYDVDFRMINKTSKPVKIPSPKKSYTKHKSKKRIQFEEEQKKVEREMDVSQHKVVDIEKDLDKLFIIIKQHLSVCDKYTKNKDNQIMLAVQKFNQQVTDIYHACYPEEKKRSGSKKRKAYSMEKRISELEDEVETNQEVISDIQDDMTFQNTPTSKYDMDAGVNSESEAIDFKDFDLPTVSTNTPVSSYTPSASQPSYTPSASQPSYTPSASQPSYAEPIRPSQQSQTSPSSGSDDTQLANDLSKIAESIRSLGTDIKTDKPSFLSKFLVPGSCKRKQQEVAECKAEAKQSSCGCNASVMEKPDLSPEISFGEKQIVTELMTSENMLETPVKMSSNLSSANLSHNIQKYSASKPEKKDGNRLSFKTSPKGFFSDLIPIRPEDYVTIVHDPRYPYEKNYKLSNIGNVIEGNSYVYLNLPIDELKSYTVKSILNNNPVFFACDVVKGYSRKFAAIDSEIYDTSSLIGRNVFTELDKKDRMTYGSGIPSHAMCISGINMENVPQSEKHKYCKECPKNKCKHDLVRLKTLKVDNSWGQDDIRDGHLVMSSKFFDDHVYQVIINKNLLSKEHQKLLKQKPYKILEAWDCLSSLCQ